MNSQAELHNIPFREVCFPPAEMRVVTEADGTLIIEPVAALEPFVPNLLLELDRQVQDKPDQAYLCQRADTSHAWQVLTYREAQQGAHALAQWLINRQIGPDRSVLILSGNSHGHAIVKLGAMAAGVPVCPISVNYALMGGDYGRLKHVIQLVKPAVVYAENTQRFCAALSDVDYGDAIVITDDPAILPSPITAVSTADVLNTPVGPSLSASIAALDPNAPAAYMLTSGSTSLPKAVIQTQRMITANLAQGRQVLGEAAGWKEVMLDWLPWNHVSGAFTMMGVLTSGGTLYIDEGRPLPGAFDTTIANLKEIPVSFFTNMPSGYAMLADALEADDKLRDVFFRKLRLALYGGAGLPQALYDRFQRLAVETTGKRIFFTTGYGATETSSGCLAIYFDTEEVGIGLPMPGLQVKLVPLEDRYEVRMKGQMITSGYLGVQAQPGEMFDADGFFKIGDAAQFCEPGNIHRGLKFAGRLAEEFKLANGTWVSAGNLRAAVVQACSPLISDALICGLNREYVAVLAWANPTAVAQLLGENMSDDVETWLASTPVRDKIAAALRAHNQALPGTSTRIVRFALLQDPPSIDGHELSDKGTVNQSVAQRRRASDVEQLYAAEPGPDILVL